MKIKNPEGTSLPFLFHYEEENNLIPLENESSNLFEEALNWSPLGLYFPRDGETEANLLLFILPLLIHVARAIKADVRESDRCNHSFPTLFRRP